MPLLSAVAFAYAIQTADPNRLKIGPPGEVTVQVGQIFDTARNRTSGLRDIVKAAEGKRFVYLGENHATTAHQEMEAAVIAALVGAGRRVIVGMEMYQRPKQPILNLWTSGSLDEEAFLAQSDWKGQWGFDFAFYRPVFDVIKANHLPLLGLNIPREWVRAVGKGGFAALPADAKQGLPSDMSLANADHRQIFTSLIGGTPAHAGAMDNMYAAQVLWDEAMADTALKYLADHPADRSTVVVIIAGSGHVLYKQGINWRISRRKGGDGVTLVMAQASGPQTFSKGIADFIFLSPEAKTKE